MERLLPEKFDSDGYKYTHINQRKHILISKLKGVVRK
jgi:hypothetical protein